MDIKLTSSNIAKYHHEWFPEFQNLDSYEDNRFVYFTDFAMFLVGRFSDENVIERAAAFIGLMCEAGDSGFVGVLDDFFINMYISCRERGLNISSFLNKLTPGSRNIYDVNIELWTRGNGTTR